MSDDFKQVFVTLSENHVVRGFYVIRNGVLTMTHGPNGKPVMLDDAPVNVKLLQNSNPDAIARQLTKKIRKAMRGVRVEGFDRVIEYPHESIV